VVALWWLIDNGDFHAWYYFKKYSRFLIPPFGGIRA
jgi:hypothetical protein